jgi:hypothetical protein
MRVVVHGRSPTGEITRRFSVRTNGVPGIRPLVAAALGFLISGEA